MNPLLIIAVAAGAFYIGQRMREAPSNGAEPLPLPPFPEPEGSELGEVPTSPQGAANLAKWEEIDFDVDVFPPGSPLQIMEPPVDAMRWRVAPGCEAIAIGHGFWQRLNDIAQPRLDVGMSVEETLSEVLDEMFSLAGPGGAGPKSKALQCIEDGTLAGKLLLAEIRDRVRFLSGGFFTAAPAVGVPMLPPDPQDAGGTWTPVKNPGLPRMTDAVMYALGRKR